MNDLFILFASWLLRLSVPAGPPQAAPYCAERETAAPTANALERAAAGRTAYLTDVLRLRYAQSRQLRQHTLAELQDLQGLSDSAAVAAAVDARYHRQLTRVLTPGQYATLLRLEAEPLGPGRAGR